MSNKKYNSWNVDMNKTLKYNDMIIKSAFGPNIKYISLETQDNEVSKWLDLYAGIDFILKSPGDKITTLASRIQFDGYYDTFTVREERYTGSKTEYDKRIHSIAKGFIYPDFTLQAYVKDINNFRVAVIKTKDLYEFIEQNPDAILLNKSDNDFLIIRWDDVKDLLIVEKEINHGGNH